MNLSCSVFQVWQSCFLQKKKKVYSFVLSENFRKYSLSFFCQFTIFFITVSHAASFIILVRLYSCSASFGSLFSPDTYIFAKSMKWLSIASGKSQACKEGICFCFFDRLHWHNAIFCWLRYIRKDKIAQPAFRAQHSRQQRCSVAAPWVRLGLDELLHLQLPQVGAKTDAQIQRIWRTQSIPMSWILP